MLAVAFMSHPLQSKKEYENLPIDTSALNQLNVSKELKNKIIDSAKSKSNLDAFNKVVTKLQKGKFSYSFDPKTKICDQLIGYDENGQEVRVVIPV